jgi:glutaredoxin
MDYLLFTYPNCVKCDRMKRTLAESQVAYQEFGLTQPLGKAKIREFLNHIKRDDKVAILLPTLIAHTQGIVRAVLTSAEEFEAWWRSKA